MDMVSVPDQGLEVNAPSAPSSPDVQPEAEVGDELEHYDPLELTNLDEPGPEGRASNFVTKLYIPIYASIQRYMPLYIDILQCFIRRW
jgi:hypothetical protein